jgi:hypothetical protein
LGHLYLARQQGLITTCQTKGCRPQAHGLQTSPRILKKPLERDSLFEQAASDIHRAPVLEVFIAVHVGFLRSRQKLIARTIESTGDLKYASLAAVVEEP